MGVIRIVVDSTSDIPAEVRQQHSIEMVPLKVLFGEETFQDAVDIGPDEFYVKLTASPVNPTTSQPSPVEFQEVYERLLGEDPETHIISIHISSKLSGTYQSATIGRSLLDREDHVTVIDSGSASFGSGVLAVRAAQLAAEGASKDAILAEIKRVQESMKLFFLVDTLEFLQRGGRIGKAAALFGSILNIKPILTIEDGLVAPADKVRGQRKAMQRIVELLGTKFDRDTPVNVIIAWTQFDQPARELLDLVKERFNVKQIDETTIGAVVGVHVGPGAAAVFMYRA